MTYFILQSNALFSHSVTFHRDKHWWFVSLNLMGSKDSLMRLRVCTRPLASAARLLA